MKTIRIANAGGFWGDWLGAPKQQILGGHVDYLTIDYLAELTMSMLAKQQLTNPDRGYVFDFVRMLEELLPEISKRNIKVISNAGGMNPHGCALAIKEVAKKLGIKERVRVAVITGDDLRLNLQELSAELKNLETGEPFQKIASRVTSANAYLGSDLIVSALRKGANIIVTGRISDAALTLAPLVYEFSWKPDDWHKLSLGVVLGHILECGAQATGGNSSFDWKAISSPDQIGFPIAEVTSDLSAYITKHPNTGGSVNTHTVTEQLIYEIGDPTNYITPDVIADFTTIKLSNAGENRVKVSNVKGKPRTESLKCSISYAAGFKAEGSLLFSWPDAVEKAELAERTIRKRLSALRLNYDEILSEYVGYNACHGPIEKNRAVSEVLLRMAVRGSDKKAVERFIRELPPLVLSGPPGISGYAGSRGGAEEVFAYWPALVPRSMVNPQLEII